MDADRDLEQWTRQIREDISANRVFVYAKGEKSAAVSCRSCSVRGPARAPESRLPALSSRP